ncbi:hypothetical protein TRFO_27885 [Tritrichomonas foetus]|uniref:Intimal thickness related receptor IRP domain-containing protein n=1 Tax=Tritrichomonas foetus TaxID=1144522 RepID=A0A1J4K1A6_9EUKA|nr:hypothetical protein TRFO_27885 [Tritrichomonas foetus]|eukprot:OHT04568.1 hypothetical protein TRFO_27885 [Tritrichomonas foetus]
MLFFFLTQAFSKFLEFNNVTAKSPYIMQKLIDTSGLTFLPNLQISKCDSSSFCHLDVIFYRYLDTEKVFPQSTSFKPMCCPKSGIINKDGNKASSKDNNQNNGNSNNDNSNKCEKNRLILKENGPYHRITKFNPNFFTKHPSDTAITSEGIWSFIVANCNEDSDYQLNGYFDYSPVFEYGDLRIRKICLIALANAIIIIAFLFTYFIYRQMKSPQPTPQHKNILFSGGLAAYSELLICGLYSFVDEKYLKIALLFSGIFRSASRSLLFYSTYSGFQYPYEVSKTPFYCAFIVLSISMADDLIGMSTLPDKLTGDWKCTYGKVPFLTILTYIVLTFSIISSTNRNTPKDCASPERRRRFLILFGLISFAFIFIDISVFFVRINSVLEFTRSIEWCTYAVEPATFILLFVANVWFWDSHNPDGYVTIRESLRTNNDGPGVDVNDGDGNSLVGSGMRIPQHMRGQTPDFVIGDDDDDLDDADAVAQNGTSLL